MSNPNTRPLLLLISAPSGAGKTTVCEQLLAATPGLQRVITCTTRSPRAGEKQGVDYHFLAPEEFHRRVLAGEFLEHATVYGHGYGTLRSELVGKLELGGDLLLNVDVQGAGSIRAAAQSDPVLKDALVTVFLTPPSVAVLEERLLRRGKDSVEAIRSRLALAQREVARWSEFNYLVISTTMQEDLRRMRVIYEAEKMRQSRSATPWL